MTDGYTPYEAFISYRHISPDAEIAEKLQKLIENYRPPKGVSQKRRITRVFRDKSELPSSADLGESLKSALLNSEYLIVIISEHTKESKWCMEEILAFKNAHGGKLDRIFPVLVSGEPADVLPEELRFERALSYAPGGKALYVQKEVEPLCCDVRADSEQERDKKLEAEFLRIVAPILGCRYDDLYQRHKRRKRKILAALLAAAVALMAAIIAVVTVFLVRESNFNSQLSEKNEELSVKNKKLTASEQRIRSDFASSYAREGSEASVAGNYQDSLMYFAEALKMDSSDRRARLGAYCTLSSWYWPVLTETKQPEIVTRELYEPPEESYDWGMLYEAPAEDPSETERGSCFYKYESGDDVTVFDAETNTAVRIPYPKASKDKTRQWSGYTGTFIRLAGEGAEKTLCLSYDGFLYIYGYKTAEGGKYSFTNGKLLYTEDMDEAFKSVSPSATSNDIVWVSPDGAYCVVFGFDNDNYFETTEYFFTVFDIAEGEWSGEVETIEDCRNITSVMFQPNGSGFVVAAKIDSPVYETDSHKFLFYQRAGSRIVSHSKVGRNADHNTVNFELSDDGKLFLVCKENCVFLLDGLTGELRCPEIYVDGVLTSAHFTDGGFTVTDKSGDVRTYTLISFDVRGKAREYKYEKDTLGYDGSVLYTFDESLRIEDGLYIRLVTDDDSDSSSKLILFDGKDEVFDRIDFDAKIYSLVYYSKNDKTGYFLDDTSRKIIRFGVDTDNKKLEGAEALTAPGYN